MQQTSLTPESWQRDPGRVIAISGGEVCQVNRQGRLNSLGRLVASGAGILLIQANHEEYPSEVRLRVELLAPADTFKSKGVVDGATDCVRVAEGVYAAVVAPEGLVDGRGLRVTKSATLFDVRAAKKVSTLNMIRAGRSARLRTGYFPRNTVSRRVQNRITPFTWPVFLGPDRFLLLGWRTDSYENSVQTLIRKWRILADCTTTTLGYKVENEINLEELLGEDSIVLTSKAPHHVLFHTKQGRLWVYDLGRHELWQSPNEVSKGHALRTDDWMDRGMTPVVPPFERIEGTYLHTWWYNKTSKIPSISILHNGRSLFQVRQFHGSPHLTAYRIKDLTSSSDTLACTWQIPYYQGEEVQSVSENWVVLASEDKLRVLDALKGVEALSIAKASLPGTPRRPPRLSGECLFLDLTLPASIRAQHQHAIQVWHILSGLNLPAIPLPNTEIRPSIEGHALVYAEFSRNLSLRRIPLPLLPGGLTLTSRGQALFNVPVGSAAPPPWDALPGQIWAGIFLRTRHRDQLHIRLVCRQWCRIFPILKIMPKIQRAGQQGFSFRFPSKTIGRLDFIASKLIAWRGGWLALGEQQYQGATPEGRSYGGKFSAPVVPGRLIAETGRLWAADHQSWFQIDLQTGKVCDPMKFNTILKLVGHPGNLQAFDEFFPNALADGTATLGFGQYGFCHWTRGKVYGANSLANFDQGRLGGCLVSAKRSGTSILLFTRTKTWEYDSTTKQLHALPFFEAAKIHVGDNEPDRLFELIEVDDEQVQLIAYQVSQMRNAHDKHPLWQSNILAKPTGGLRVSQPFITLFREDSATVLGSATGSQLLSVPHSCDFAKLVGNLFCLGSKDGFSLSYIRFRFEQDKLIIIRHSVVFEKGPADSYAITPRAILALVKTYGVPKQVVLIKPLLG